MKLIKSLWGCFAILLISGTASRGQNERVSIPTGSGRHPVLWHRIDSIIKKYNGSIGVAVSGTHDFDVVTVNNYYQYPTQSVFKFPLALFVLHKVDKGALSLGQKVHVNKEDLHKTWSPLRDKYPEGNIDLTIAELLEYTISKSDNNTCDILFRLVKGTSRVQKYLHLQNIDNMNIAATESEMAAGWDVQYTNWAEPLALMKLLSWFSSGYLLTEQSTKFLNRLMTESENSPNRIKGLLPSGTVVAHKTGTSNTNEKGITASVNDVGIITLPDSNKVTIAVFVSNTKETKETAEKIIAQIARASYDYFVVVNQHHAEDSFVLLDKTRNREIPVTVYYPHYGHKLSQTHLVILNHGYNGNKLGAYKQYSYLANHLATRSYFVASIQHELPTDDTLAMTGNMSVTRRPNWERGVQNIRFTIAELKKRYPYLDYDHIIILGHSNGGDMAMLMATEYPDEVDRVISLDNRRMPIPRVRQPKIYTIRSSDQPADEGVLPTQDEQSEYRITVIKQNNVKHNDMDDDANESQREELQDYVMECLHDRH